MDLPIAALHGALLRRDVITAVGHGRLDNALRSGELRALWTGVVVEAARWLDPWTRAAAAQLLAGPGSALAGVTAAFLHGCRSVDTAAAHVLVPYGRRLRSRNGLVIHHGGFFNGDTEDIEGLRVLPFDRVIADILCTPRRSDALAVADEALRLAGPRDEDRMRLAIGDRIRQRQDPRGTVKAVGLLDLASSRVDSPAESWLRLLLVDDGFPVPEVNWPITGIDGREQYRVDLAWPALRIALEYDGQEAHEGHEEADLARQADLERRGWIVVRGRREDLRDPTRMTVELRAAFARRGYTW
jgi:hypothetical protein